jgi:hypothetical protein
MTAGVQKDVNASLLISSQDDRFFTHARDEKITGVRDQGFVSHKQPDTGKNLLQLTLVDLRIHENLSAD